MSARSTLLATTSLLLAIINSDSLQADFTFGTPTNLGPAINSSANEFGPYLSPDGLEFYFCRGTARADIWIARRKTLDSEWEPASRIGAPVDLADNSTPFLTPDGLTLFLDGNRPGTLGTFDLWVTTRSDDWGTPVNLGATVNSSAEDWGASLSSDGLELYFTSNRPGGSGSWDLWMARRATVDDDWVAPVNLGPPLNTSAADTFASISSDGLALFFCSARTGGQLDLYMTRRATTKDSWGSPVNLGPTVNSSAVDNCVKVSADGSRLYFASLRAGGLGNGDIWQVPILPIVDFNFDEQIDIQDLAILIEHWGQADPQCDIGPMPWGDGTVDAKDLEILMRHWGQEVNDPRLVASWRLDETEGIVARDKAGAHHGTLVGGPIWQPTGGRVGGALQLDGIDDYVSAPFVMSPAEGAFSVFAWIKGGAPGQVILSQEAGAHWLCVDTQGCLMTELKLTGRSAKNLASAVVITDGAWHRVGLVWDGGNRILYVDGTEVARDALGAVTASGGGLAIGSAYSGVPGAFWKGLIDDVRIYNQAVKP